MYYFSTPRELLTKVDIVGESAWNGDDQDPSQIHGSLFALVYLTVSSKSIPGAVQS